ncbi:hypothetical protein HYW75_05460 [Candidatus Pacearchaeota archaeon]|nr:hypothetical protein [Candidatus Pacearchaeota archaeon]
MEENPATVQQFYSGGQMRLRDQEDQMRLLRERVLLIGQTIINEKEKSISDIRDIKNSLLILKEENTRIKEILSNITEQIEKFARKEDLSILQRQFDLFREKNNKDLN